MKTVQLRSEINEHARDVLSGLCAFYGVPRAVVLRVIMESVLDAASEDGGLQAQLAEATRYCQHTGYVPDCWLDLEGARFEDGPDDSGTSPDCPLDSKTVGDWSKRRPDWEQDDTGAAIRRWGIPGVRFAPEHGSLADA